MRADARRQLIELHKTPTGRTRTHTAVLCTLSKRRTLIDGVEFEPCMHHPARKKSGSLDFQALPRTQPARVPIIQSTTRGSPHDAKQRHPAAKNERSVLRRSSLAVDIPSPLAQA